MPLWNILSLPQSFSFIVKAPIILALSYLAGKQNAPHAPLCFRLLTTRPTSAADNFKWEGALQLALKRIACISHRKPKENIISNLLFACVFLGGFSLHSLGWPGTMHIRLTLNLWKIHLPLPSESLTPTLCYSLIFNTHYYILQCWGLNLGPHAWQASILPLSYTSSLQIWLRTIYIHMVVF